MIRRHPSKKALRSWLAGDIDPDVDRHVSTCDRCSSELEHLDTPEAHGPLRDALLTALEPPADLVPRVEAGVTARLDSRHVFGFVADLFGVGWEATRLLITVEE